EAGPSYVHENFDVAANDSYVGGRWALNYEQRLWDDFTFYHFNEALLSVHDTGNLTVRSRTGVRMSLTDHVIARVQTAVDWNNSPPENTDSTDFEHTLTVGYAF